MYSRYFFSDIHDTSSFQGNVKQLVQENNTLKEKLTRQTGEVSWLTK